MHHPVIPKWMAWLNVLIWPSLTKSLLACGGEWDGYLKHVAFAYNTSVHSSTSYSPYYLIHGRETQVPVNVLVPSQVSSDLPSCHADFVASMAGKLETAFCGARQSSVQAHEKQKLCYDGAVRHTPYAVGDQVWLHNPTEDRMKLALHWKGAYRILAVLGSQGGLRLTYRIACPLDSRGRTQVFHYDRLKRYTLPLNASNVSKKEGYYIWATNVGWHAAWMLVYCYFWGAELKMLYRNCYWVSDLIVVIISLLLFLKNSYYCELYIMNYFDYE